MEQIIEHYYPPTRIRFFLIRNGFLFSRSNIFSIRLLNARNTVITSIAYGFPFHVGVCLFKEILLVCKWAYIIVKYLWNTFSLSSGNEKSFYQRNFSQVFIQHTSQLWQESVKYLVICSSSLLLMSIGMGISSYINPSLDTNYIHTNLSSLRYLLL